MGKDLGRKSMLKFFNRFKLIGTRPYCSSTQNKQPNTVKTISNSSSNGPSPLSKYDEQYKALNNLDFMTAAKILFTEPQNKKKFGLDFHLVQLFFTCLPSLAVYLVAQYARSEMRKMDADLELKKQAEFEAQAKEMERKAAEERAAVASNPELLEVKERLGKIEETVKQIVGESKRKSGEGQSDGNEPQAAQARPDHFLDKSEASSSKECPTASVVTSGSADNQNVTKHGGSSQKSEK